MSENLKLTRYAHGLGFGDVNGDGRTDFIQSRAGGNSQNLSKMTLYGNITNGLLNLMFQMLVYDVDDDGTTIS